MTLLLAAGERLSSELMNDRENTQDRSSSADVDSLEFEELEAGIEEDADSALLQSADTSFEAQAMPYLDQLYRTALGYVKNPSDAEDLVQETFLKAHRAYASFEQGTNIRAWLHRILFNSFVNLYRKKQRQPYQNSLDEVEDWQMGGAESMTSTASKSAEAEAIDNLPDTDVKTALQNLPEDFRFAVYLVDVEGFSYQETAEIMKTPQGTVMSRLHRGRKMLRESLKDYAIERGIIRAGGEN
ncbi:MAG: sigma-70 family RNA polymerase sigma factor [Microbacteriaceae bacterium]